jgi:hypothetical protein
MSTLTYLDEQPSQRAASLDPLAPFEGHEKLVIHSQIMVFFTVYPKRSLWFGKQCSIRATFTRWWLSRHAVCLVDRGTHDCRLGTAFPEASVSRMGGKRFGLNAAWMSGYLFGLNVAVRR